MNRKFLALILLFTLSLVLFPQLTLYSSVSFDRNNPAIALILDRSGSMGYSNYLTPAKQRAQTFVGLMQNGDHVTVASYSETATVNFAITTIVGDATRTAAQNAINALQSGGRTSIGSGLVAGRNQLTNSSATGQKAMLLLSDGLDNLAPFAIHIVPGIPASMDVYTIALGPNSDQPLLQWIANQTGGTYHYAPNAAVLQQIYDTINGSLRGYQNYFTDNDAIEPLETVTQIVNVDPAEFLYFTVTTDELFSQDQSLLSFHLIDPDGVEINEQNIVIEGYGDLTTGFSYSSFRINQPLSGTWQMVLVNNSNEEQLDYDLSVWGRSTIEMHQIIPIEGLIINQPLELIVDIADSNIPLSGCLVAAKIILPAEVRGSGKATTFPFEERESSGSSPAKIQRNTEIELVLTETSAGRYEVLFYDTEIAGSYTVEITALIEVDGQTIERKSLRSFCFAPPDQIPAPILLYPDNDAQNLDTAIEFIWTPVLNADSYQIQIANNQEILIDHADLSENAITIVLPAYDAEYIWRVRAAVDGADGTWSEVSNFTTGIPDIPAPQNLAGILDSSGIILTWEQPETNEFYGDPWYYKIYRDNNYYGYVLASVNSYLDELIYPDQPYTYHITAKYYSGAESLPSNTTTMTFLDADIPDVNELHTTLSYNYPNPFNPETRILFSLAEAQNVTLNIYDIEGRLVDKLYDGYLEGGEHSIIWRGRNSQQRNVPSGVYFIKMSTAGYTGYRKLLLLK